MTSGTAIEPRDTEERSAIVAPAPSWRLRLSSALRRILVPGCIVLLWILVSQNRLVPPLYLPSASGLWHAFEGMKAELGHAIVSSVGMTLTGFIIGSALGVSLGLLMAFSRVVRELFGGVLDFLRPVPVFALIPLFVLWFGIGRAPQIALIALGVSVILGVTTLTAIRNVSTTHVKAALTLGASRWDVYRTVIVPSILPHLLGSIRVAAAASWGLDVAAEFLGAQSGLGYLMINREQYLDTAGIILIVLLYSLFALGLDWLIRKSESPLTRWTDRGATGPVSGLLGI